MISRKPDSSLREAVKIPGPGSYDPDMRNKKNRGNVRIGSASRENLNKEMIKTPGPGAYDARVDGVKHKEPAVRMGTSLRRPLSANNAAPGPGAYEIQSRVFEGPKVNISIVFFFSCFEAFIVKRYIKCSSDSMVVRRIPIRE